MEHLDGFEMTASMILKDHASTPVRKERLNPTSIARMEASRNKFMKKSGMPGTVKSRNCLRARPRFVKPIGNVLRKIKNLIGGRLSRVKTGMVGRENAIRLQKEAKTRKNDAFKQLRNAACERDGRKEAGESRSFPMLWMVIILDGFQIKGKECNDQERLKM